MGHLIGKAARDRCLAGARCSTEQNESVQRGYFEGQLLANSESEQRLRQQPVPDAFGVTISDVTAVPVPERPSSVGRLAVASWSAWSAHHDTVRALLDSLSDDVG
jgi:hypothetical protein